MSYSPRNFVVAALVLLATACASTPPLEAVSDFDSKHDFSGVESFTILPIDRTSAAERLLSDMEADRIDDALAVELQRRGFRVVDERADADLYLSWHLATRERTDIRSYNASSAYQCWRCGPPVSDVRVRQYTEGTFIVDLIDPMRNRSVWRSTIQTRLNEAPDPNGDGELRATAARVALEAFPPAASDGE